MKFTKKNVIKKINQRISLLENFPAPELWDYLTVLAVELNDLKSELKKLK